jgi:hypothetical protein
MYQNNNIIDDVENNNNNNVNDIIENQYKNNHHVADYIAMLKFKLIDSEHDINKYKLKYNVYRALIILSIIAALCFVSIYAKTYYLIPGIILTIGILYGNSQSYILCYGICYIFLILLMVLQMVEVLLYTHI